MCRIAQHAGLMHATPAQQVQKEQGQGKGPHLGLLCVDKVVAVWGEAQAVTQGEKPQNPNLRTVTSDSHLITVPCVCVAVLGSAAGVPPEVSSSVLSLAHKWFQLPVSCRACLSVCCEATMLHLGMFFLLLLCRCSVSTLLLQLTASNTPSTCICMCAWACVRPPAFFLQALKVSTLLLQSTASNTPSACMCMCACMCLHVRVC